jgi:tetratricopeptide (TPR) repeat protein
MWKDFESNSTRGSRKGCLVLLVLAAVFAARPLSGAAAPESPASLKEKALAEFEKADYAAAIAYLQKARGKAPNDAEVYYYLGYFTHFLCYDSVPLAGFDRDNSDEVLDYLRRAVELDPNLGNAYYFIGAEYGARAREEMQDGNVSGAAEQFRLGRREGGYPAWMLEFGRNLLKSCRKDAILFTGGDADTNPVEYLQVVDGYRRDVTVIPFALLERPWFVLLLKRGLQGAVRAAPLSWDERQIMGMHPYKWQTNTIRIPVSDDARSEFGPGPEAVDWELADEDGRLSAGRAAMADILVSNRFERPVYFSSGVSNAVMDGLNPYIQVCGVARRLLPVPGRDQVDVETTTKLMLEPGNFEAVPTVRTQDMPRVSGLLVNYGASYLYLALHYSRADEATMVKTVIEAMKRNVPEDIVPMPESLGESVRKFEQWLAEHG